MAVDPSVLINLAAEYTGKPAFDKASKATSSLEKNVKKLAKTFGIAFGTTAIVNFSKQAVKAFAQDEAAAIRLNRAVDNLGIGFANPAITKYIAELERSAAIADDILRPAFQGLLTTTGSLTKSQELLNNAITISRASGIDLATVSQDLANGYVGITKGLKKYNTGLTTAELSSKSFAEVLGVLLTRSAGAATDYLDTTQYKMDALTIATGNASEIIGGGLVNAFARIGGGTEASDAAKAIEDIATAVAFTTETIGSLIGVIPSLLSTLKNIPKNLVEGFAGSAAGRNLTPKPLVTKTPTQITQQQQAKLLAKLEADAIKRQKALLALQKKQSDAAKKAAAEKAKLAKAQSIFDLDKIQIEAALKGKISDEERTRLLLLQAIAEEDADKVETLSKKLEEIQKKNEAIAKSLLAIGQAKDPFSTWAGSLTAALLELNKVGEKMFAIRQKESGYVDTSILSGNTFPQDATPEQIVAIVEKAVAVAETAAIQAAESVAQTQTATEALAKSADAAVAIAETLGVIDTANVLGVAADIANQAQSSSIFNPLAGMTTQSVAAARAADLIASGSNAGAGTASSMFNPYGTTPGSSAGFGNSVPYVYVTVNNNGSVIMQDDFVDAVNNAILEADRTGYGRTPAGRIAI